MVENLGFRQVLHILIYLFYLNCLYIFLCSISGNGLHFSCEIVQWRSQSVEFIAKHVALFACPLLHRIH